MPIEIKILGPEDESILANVLSDVFDNPVNKKLTSEFFAGSRHHLAIAINDGQVVGFASAVDYIHPDKSQGLCINKVGVSSNFRNRGLAKLALGALLQLGHELGCREAWVLTDRPKTAVMRLYESLGATVRTMLCSRSNFSQTP